MKVEPVTEQGKNGLDPLASLAPARGCVCLTGFQNQGTNGANSDALATVLTKGSTHRFIPKGGDHPSETPMGKAYNSLARFLLADPDTSAAKHTLIGVINEQRAGGVYR